MSELFDLSDETTPAAKAARAMQMPIGAASPLWVLFAGAASAGVAYWWLTRWRNPTHLEAMAALPSAPLEEPEAPPAVDVETLEVEAVAVSSAPDGSAVVEASAIVLEVEATPAEADPAVVSELPAEQAALADAAGSAVLDVAPPAPAKKAVRATPASSGAARRVRKPKA